MSSNHYVILLTYKGKVLLLSEENSLDALPCNPWKFIEKYTKGKYAKEELIREVLKEAKIKISNVTPIFHPDATMLHEKVYYADLSDIHVNNIQRKDTSLLQFYSLKELQKLNLQDSSKHIFVKYRSVFEELLN